MVQRAQKTVKFVVRRAFKVPLVRQVDENSFVVRVPTKREAKLLLRELDRNLDELATIETRLHALKPMCDEFSDLLRQVRESGEEPSVIQEREAAFRAIGEALSAYTAKCAACGVRPKPEFLVMGEATYG